jgi:hypothetical protein
MLNFATIYHFMTVIEGFSLNVSLRDKLPDYHILLSERKRAYLNCGLILNGNSE